MQEILTRVIDSLNIHLKYYEKSSKGGRGFIISKLFSCLLEWIMSIEPNILTETDLCQLVFDVIELALHVTIVRATEEKKRYCNNSNTFDRMAMISFYLIHHPNHLNMVNLRKFHLNSSHQKGDLLSTKTILDLMYLKATLVMSRSQQRPCYCI